ncbi:MAG: hypothetical protein ACI9JN_000088 [Bacteroidia bacterium]|jgi:hypothetical protein
MKNIILATIAVLTISPFSFSQTTFIDGSEHYVYRQGYSLDRSTYASFFKETVNLDSVVDKVEFYSINRDKERQYLSKVLTDTLSYQLRVVDRKVYFSGSYYSDSNKVISTVQNILMYDYNLKAGDTLFFATPLAYACIIDSVKMETYFDGKSRVTQYVRGFEGSKMFDNPRPDKFRLIEGFGSTSGIIYQNTINNGYPPERVLISICLKDSMRYFDSSFNRILLGDFCDEQHVQSMIDKLAKVSVKKRPHKQMLVFPNPASDRLNLPDGLSGKYVVMDHLGLTVKEGDTINSINISSLSPQLYFIQLFTDEFIGVSKFIKE